MLSKKIECSVYPACDCNGNPLVFCVRAQNNYVKILEGIENRH